MESIVSVMEHDIKAEFFFKKEKKVFLYCLCHSEEHMIQDFPHPWINSVNVFFLPESA